MSFTVKYIYYLQLTSRHSYDSNMAIHSSPLPKEREPFIVNKSNCMWSYDQAMQYCLEIGWPFLWAVIVNIIFYMACGNFKVNIFKRF